jgi:hypothetical protein
MTAIVAPVFCSDNERETVAKFNVGDKVRVTGGYVTSGGILEVGHEDVIDIFWDEESHIHELTGEAVDSYILRDSDIQVTDDELELIQ